ncbi:unnamed protein product, partial [Sphagnum balticum]
EQAPAEVAPRPIPVETFPKLPKELAGAKSGYKTATPQFASDVDKALYIVREKSSGKSKSHDKYIDYLKNTVGLSDGEIRKGSEDVLNAVKQSAEGKSGKVDVPNVQGAEPVNTSVAGRGTETEGAGANGRGEGTDSAAAKAQRGTTFEPAKNVVGGGEQGVLGGMEQSAKQAMAAPPNNTLVPVTFPVQLRGNPTITLYDTAGNSGKYSEMSPSGVISANIGVAGTVAIGLQGFYAGVSTGSPPSQYTLMNGFHCVATIQGIASMTPVQVSQATAANLNATVTGSGTAGTPATGVVTIQGINGGTPQAVSSVATTSVVTAGTVTASSAYTSGNVV